MKTVRFALAVLALVVTTTACATAPKATPLMLSAEPVAIVMATAIIAPEALVTVVTDAVKASPTSAIAIASAAALAAPDQALAIRSIVVQAAPLNAAEIVRVTAVKRRQVVAQIRVPKADEMLAILKQVPQ